MQCEVRQVLSPVCDCRTLHNFSCLLIVTRVFNDLDIKVYKELQTVSKVLLVVRVVTAGVSGSDRQMCVNDCSLIKGLLSVQHGCQIFVESRQKNNGSLEIF